ncbi:hypothetical protein BGZ95_011583 [Linnemannia exigua]|uniref:Uncharacterized protein n=1 Tax=Linnemannia exigua TaxID=604196 RepID=A0AAD4DJQ8_9FUNG|nr:hypothetical protein BGZ95_011583 [Linnemannia exigua]
MSSADVIAPSTITANKPRRGLASIKTMFSTKRHTIAQIPSAISEDDSNTQLSPPSESSDAVDSPAAESSHSSSSSSSSLHKASLLFTPNQKKAAEKAAEKEKKDQVKQAIQLSTVDHHGAFLPPTPLEKGYKDHFKDNDTDYFDTIISTPPERVRTFLSAASTISPGMFSLPSSKIKRHTFTSFPTTYWSVSAASSSLAPTSPTIDAMPIAEEQQQMGTPAKAPMVPPKDTYYTPKKQHQQIRNRAQISFLTGDGSDDLTEALADSISSLLSGPSSPSSQGVPDLMDDDEHSSGSESSSSANVSPRHSTASLQKEHLQSSNKKLMKKWQPEELSLGGELAISP